jgi:hypothetical protein
MRTLHSDSRTVSYAGDRSESRSSDSRKPRCRTKEPPLSQWAEADFIGSGNGHGQRHRLHAVWVQRYGADNRFLHDHLLLCFLFHSHLSDLSVRVTRNGRSYCFFGKAPLHLIDKWHIGIVLALILFVLVPAILVNEPTARPTGTATPSTTTPPKLDFVPDSTTSRGGAPQEVFRTRNEQRRILNAEKEQIEQDRTRLNRLERQSEDLSREIERDRLFLNRESQFQVDSYNAKVDQYNELVQQAKTATAAFNERVRNYNAQLGQLQR